MEIGLEFIADYGLFLAKAITFVIAFAVIVVIIASQKNNQNADKGQLEINPLNDQYDEISQAMNAALLDKAAKKAEAKRIKKEQKKKAKASSPKDDLDTEADKRIFVVKFNGNISASAVTNLREEMSGARWLLMSSRDLQSATGALMFAELDGILIGVDHRGEEIIPGLWQRAVHLMLVSEQIDADEFAKKSGITKVIANDSGNLEDYTW